MGSFCTTFIRWIESYNTTRNTELCILSSNFLIQSVYTFWQQYSTKTEDSKVFRKFRGQYHGTVTRGPVVIPFKLLSLLCKQKYGFFYRQLGIVRYTKWKRHTDNFTLALSDNVQHELSFCSYMSTEKLSFLNLTRPGQCTSNKSWFTPKRPILWAYMIPGWKGPPVKVPRVTPWTYKCLKQYTPLGPWLGGVYGSLLTFSFNVSITHSDTLRILM